MEIALLTIVLLSAIVLLVTQRIRIEVTAILIIVSLPILGLLTPAEALSGFANEATITVAALLMLSAGLVRTGALDFLVRVLGRFNVKNPRVLIVILGLIAAVPSAFLNNTAVVIMLIPVILRICQKNGIVPSKVMIPLSYFAILGGTLTLVGTSTNILVDSLYRQHGGEGFRMFEFAPMGLLYLLLGALILFFFADRVLPERKVLSLTLEPKHRKNFVTEIVIPEGSELVGVHLEAFLSGFEDIRLLELVHDEEVILRPPLEYTVQGGDNLLIEGTPNAIHRLLDKAGLDLASAVADDQRVKINRIDLLVVEAVVTPNSPFFNQRLSEIGLNRIYGIKVLGILRYGRHLHSRLREMRVLVGDVLLIQGEEHSLRELEATGNVLLIERVEETLRFSRKAPLAVAIMVVVVGAAAAGWMPLSILALGGSAALMLSRCLRVREALSALESSVLLLLAAALPLGIAMEKTGMAEVLAQSVVKLAEGFGPVVLVGAIYLVTSILTAFITNAATAALLTPIVLRIALDAGVDAKPLLVAVTFGASASFFTPIGYQTNLLVMGPGGYFFRDYLRIGLLMNLVLWVAAIFMIPMFWPLR